MNEAIDVHVQLDQYHATAMQIKEERDKLLLYLKGMTFAFNSARLVMDKESRDLAGEIIAEAEEYIAKVERRP